MSRQSEVNRRAWEIARELQKEQGGTVKDHFKEGIQRAWAEAKAPKQEPEVKKAEVRKPIKRVPVYEPENIWKVRIGWLKLAGIVVVIILMGTILGMIRWAADVEREVRKAVRWVTGKVRIYWPVVREELVKGWRFRAELIEEWR